MKKAAFILWFWIGASVLYAQDQSAIDSLERALAQYRDAHTQRLQALDKLTDELLMFFPQKARSHAKEGVSLAQSLNNRTGEAKALKQIGLSYYYEQFPDSSRLFLQQALGIYRTEGDSVGIAAILHNIGLNYYTEGKYTQCLNYYIQSINIEEAMGHTAGLIPSYANVAIVLEAQQQYSQALDYYQKALVLAEATSHAIAKVQITFNIARLCYMSEEWEKGILYADSSILIAQQIQMPFGIGKSNGIKADILLAQKKYKEALQAVLVAEDIFTKISSPVDLFNLGITRVNIHEALGEYSQMEATIGRITSINDQAPSFENSRKIQYALYRLYKHTGDSKNGLKAFESYVQYRDSAYALEKTAKINELMTKYETAKKEQEIQSLQQQSRIQQLELQQKNNLIIIGGVAAILVSIIFYLFYQRKKLQQQRSSLKMEQRLLRSQLNPHFIFNALNAIQDFILRNSASEGGIYLAQFAQLMRGILESSREEFVSLEKEAELLESYLSLQQIRFNQRFDYHIEIDEAIDPEEISIPPMFAQPFLENAIEHGISSLESKGAIELIFLQAEKSTVKMVIRDNGVGIQAPKKPEGKQHQSLATKITEERIEAFKKSMNQQISFHIEPIEQGTQVTFTLPFQYI